MKKYFSFIMMAMMMALPLVFTACSDDDDDDNDGSNGGNIENVEGIYLNDASVEKLVGTWRCISSYYYEKVNGKIVDEEKDEEVGSIIVISRNGSSMGGTMVSNAASGEVDNMNWKVQNGLFYTSDEDYWAPFVITELTDKRMTLIGTYTETYESNTYTVYNNVVLERVR